MAGVLADERMSPQLKTLLKRALLVCGILGLVLIVFAARFGGITDPNVADYAQIARHVARGEGFTTSVLSPLSLSIVPRTEGHPELSRPPLYVCFLALAMLIGGATDTTVGLTSAFFFLATLVLTYLVARRCFDEQVAVFAVIITAIAAPLLRNVVTGSDTALLTFMVTLLFGVVFWRETSETRRDHWWPIVFGVLLGVCYLVRYEAIALVPAVLTYYWLSRRRAAWRGCGMIMLAFGVVIAPWVIRSSIVAGRPLASLHRYELVMFSDRHPMQTLERSFLNVPPSLAVEVLSDPRSMIKKFNEGLRVLYPSISQLANPFVTPFFIVGLLLGATRKRFSRPQVCLFLAMICMTIVLCFYMPLPRLLLAFVPMVAMIAVAWFVTLLREYFLRDQKSRSTRIAKRPVFVGLIIWTVVACYPLLDELFTGPSAQEHPIVEISREIGARGCAPVATDIPWFVAWHGETKALLLPQNGLELTHLIKARLGPRCIYLSPALMRMPPAEKMRYWQEIFMSAQDSDDFHRNTSWQLGGLLYELTQVAPDMNTETY